MIRIINITVLLALLLSLSVANAQSVQRFNNNVDAAATSSWENNWIAHVSGVSAAVVSSGSNGQLPFGMPLNHSPDYTGTGSAAKGHIILSLQSDMMTTSIKNCLLADTAEKIKSVHVGVEGSVLGILVEDTTNKQRFFQSTLQAAGCPKVVEKTIVADYTKLFLASDNTLSAKKADNNFAVLNYSLDVKQEIPATQIKLTTYLNNNLNAAASVAFGATPVAEHGTLVEKITAVNGTDTRDPAAPTFFADRLAFDNIGNFGGTGSAFAKEEVTVNTAPGMNAGLISTPGGGYAFQGAANGLADKFAARPEVLLRTGGAPQDCLTGEAVWEDKGVDGTGHHIFNLVEGSGKNVGKDANAFEARSGTRWAARYTLNDSSLVAGLGDAGEKALWNDINKGIYELSGGAAGSTSAATREAAVKELVTGWFDNKYIHNQTALGVNYPDTAGKYAYFKDSSVNTVSSILDRSAAITAVMAEFKKWIDNGNPSELGKVVLNLQTGLGLGSDARCGIQVKPQSIEVRDYDNLSAKGQDYVNHMKSAQYVFNGWFFVENDQGDHEYSYTLTWNITSLTEAFITKAEKCITEHKDSAQCVSDFYFDEYKLGDTGCLSSSYKVTKNGTPERQPQLGCNPWGADTDDKEGDPAFSKGSGRVTVDGAALVSISSLDDFYGKKTVSGQQYYQGCSVSNTFATWPSFIGTSFPFAGDYGVNGFAASAAKDETAGQFAARGFYRTKTQALKREGSCASPFGSTEMVAFFFAPSKATYTLNVDAVGSNKVRTGSSNSDIRILNESGAPMSIGTDGKVTLQRGLYTLRVAFEVSTAELAGSINREQRVAIKLDGSEESLPLFLSERLARAKDSLTVNEKAITTKSDQLWDGEYKPNVFVGLKTGVSPSGEVTNTAEVADLRGLGGRFGIQSVYSAGNKLLAVSTDDAQKQNPRLRFDLVNSLSASTADVGVNIDTVGVKTAGLSVPEMIKVWEVQPSVSGGAYVLVSFKRGSLAFKGDQSWGLWADTASKIGTKAKSVGSNGVGETFALLNIDPIQGVSWVSDPVRVSQEDVAQASITLPGTSNYASIALQVNANATDVMVKLPSGQEQTIAANTGGYTQLWVNKDLGWFAADNELTTLFGLPPYQLNSGVVGIPLDLKGARLDALDTKSAFISQNELTEAVSLKASMLFIPLSMPAGSTQDNSLIVKKTEGGTFEIIPLRPGKFQLQFPRSANNPLDTLSIIVDARMPSAANADEAKLLVTHIADAPPVDLDPLTTDTPAFVQLAYAQAPGVVDAAKVGAYTDLKVFGSLFYHDDPQKITAESSAAQAVLVYKVESEWVIRVVQSYRWNNKAVYDASKRDVAWVGQEIAHPNHYRGVNDDIRGYLVGLNGHQGKVRSVINLGIITNSIYASANMEKRTPATSPLYPVADSSKFTEQTYAPVNVVWYENDLNVAWPNMTVRYDTRYPATLEAGVKFSAQMPGKAPSIIMGSQLGSEGFSYAGQADAYTDAADGTAKADVAKAELFFEPDLTQNLKVYRQPVRGLEAYNPNEEHALIAEAKNGGGKRKAVFALRNDLNSTGDNAYTSEPFTLVQYEKRTKRADGTYTDWIPAMRGYHVVTEDAALGYTFQIKGIAGQPVAPPYPLDIILPAAQGPYMGLKDAAWEVNTDKATAVVAPIKFEAGLKSMAFWRDRNGEFWHAAATPSAAELVKLNWAYPLQGEFDMPEELAGGDACVVPVSGVMLWCTEGSKRITSTHTVTWPTKVAELWAGETAVFAGGYASAQDTTKTGLPGMVGMASAELLYDTKNPAGNAYAPAERKNKFSAAVVPVLSETTMDFPFADWPDALKPNTKNTEVEGEKWLFADLAPTFKDRLYYDIQRQKLIFKGRVAGKILGDKTLTQAPIGPVLLESNVASQELVNQVWDLFAKHSLGTDALKQKVASLLRQSREPSMSSLIEAADLQDEAGFKAIILKNWLVGARDVPSATEITSAVKQDVNAMFAATLSSAAERFVDYHEPKQLESILATALAAKMENTLKHFHSCTIGFQNNGIDITPVQVDSIFGPAYGTEVTQKAEANKSEVQTNLSKQVTQQVAPEVARWLIANAQLSEAYTQTDLSSYLDTKRGDLGLVALEGKASSIFGSARFTKIHRVDMRNAPWSIRVLSAQYGCSFVTTSGGTTLQDALFAAIKDEAIKQIGEIENIRQQVRAAASTDGALLSRLDGYWKAPETNNKLSKPQTPAVYNVFKTAVDEAIIAHLDAKVAAKLDSVLLNVEVSSKGKQAAANWKTVAAGIPFSALLTTHTADSEFTGGVTGLKDRIVAWRWDLSVSGDQATSVNKAALGPGIALVSNPEMMKGGDAWAESSYVTVVENNDPSVAGLPISVHVVKVNPTKLATPALMPLQPGNVFDEKVSLIVSNDFAGNLSDLRFDWRWREDTGTDANRKYLPNVAPLETCDNGKAITTTAGWEKAIPFTDGQEPLGHHTLSITGNSYKALVDNLVYVRYRHKDSNQWSAWLGAANHNACHATAPNYVPQLASGWVKRVVTGLNPFESRMKTISGSKDAPASYVSMLQQAGQRYEGPVALNGLDKDVLESMGLIQAYETVLNRARNMSIDRGESVFRTSVGTAIQLVSNRLAQLYTLMGNEGYNDSLDGTVPNVDSTAVNLASLHAFKNMMGSPIDEELALLRGKEEIGASPSYNRLLWNYTKGEGEVAYNATYFISDVNKNGLINEQDAGRLYPQGHGDAWGHYLHALDYYYELLIHPNYTWVAMGESFTLAGQAFDVDYNDEEQFARIAAEKAQVGATVADITFRKLYDPISSDGMAAYPDSKRERAWGVAEWTQRATTGAYFDWLTVNAMTPSALPAGYNLINNGVGVIARGSIPEINTIASSVGGIASTLNALEADSNPFGLNDATVAFDLDTERYKKGDGLFRQTWERANTAVKNAHTIFSAIADARRAQKKVATTADEWQKEIEDKDRSYRDQLIEIYGKPYEGAIGAGKPYPEGYKGPDLQFYNFVDINEVSDETIPRASAENLKSSFSVPITLTKMGDDRNSASSTETNNISSFIGLTDVEGWPGAKQTGFELEDLKSAVAGKVPELISYEAVLGGKKPDAVKSIAAQAPADWEKRVVKGRLQTLVHDALMAEADLQLAVQDYDGLLGGATDLMKAVQAEYGIPPQDFKVKNDALKTEQSYDDAIKGLDATKQAITFARATLDGMEAMTMTTAKASEAISQVELVYSGIGTAAAAQIVAAGAIDATEKGLEMVDSGLSAAQFGIGWKLERVQQGNALNIEYDDLKQEFNKERAAALRSTALEMNNLMGDEPGARLRIFKAQEALASALDAYRTELDKGLRLLEERASYNRRVAAQIQQLRYQDSTSRVALDSLSTKYRRAFDLASQYVYMAARAYDYETNLKPENALSGASQVANLAKQRLVGRYETQGGAFLPVVGYDGLAETLAVLDRNYNVLVSRLGLSVSNVERNVFSLRKEMLSIGKQAANDDRWLDALSEKYRVDDLWTAPEAAPWRTYARTFAPRDAGSQPGLVIPFSTTIEAGKNFFGSSLKGGDSTYDPSSAVTRIESMSVILDGYDTQNLSATPRVYVVPVGIDRMIYADSKEREYTGWQVKEKVLPLIFETSRAKVEATNFSPVEDTQQGFVNAIKKFSTLRAYTSDAEAASNGWSGSTRLAGRSVWNDQWLLVIPGKLLLNDADEGLNRLIYGSPDASDSVALKDIKLLINSTSVSGN